MEGSPGKEGKPKVNMEENPKTGERFGLMPGGE